MGVGAAGIGAGDGAGVDASAEATGAEATGARVTLTEGAGSDASDAGDDPLALAPVVWDSIVECIVVVEDVFSRCEEKLLDAPRYT